MEKIVIDDTKKVKYSSLFNVCSEITVKDNENKLIVQFKDNGSVVAADKVNITYTLKKPLENKQSKFSKIEKICTLTEFVITVLMFCASIKILIC